MNNSSNSQSWGLTLLRVVVGMVFLVHGGQKLFIWGFSGVAGFLGGLGIPFPAFFGVLLTIVELLAGAALAVGLLTRWAALLLALDMLGAIFIFHWKHGFFMPTGVEYPLTLLAANVAVLLSGPGAASVDGLIARRN